MTKKLLEQELLEVQILGGSIIPDLIVDPMIEVMIDAGMKDYEILDLISQARTSLHFFQLETPNETSKVMCRNSISVLDYHDQTWLDETRLEIEQEKMHVLETS